MTTRTIGDITIECVEGDIVDQPDVDAIVNAANAQLRPGGGVAGAIHRAAGPALAEGCAPLAPIRPGEAVITGGHDLPNPHVIHSLGPVYGRDEPADELLAACYRNALARAEETALESVVFPSISTGAFGFPVEAAAGIAIDAVVGAAPTLNSLRRIRFVLHGKGDHATYARALEHRLPA
ncbi:MAG: macro domain-containing protein [Guyparkeria sp.]